MDILGFKTVQAFKTKPGTCEDVRKKTGTIRGNSEAQLPTQVGDLVINVQSYEVIVEKRCRAYNEVALRKMLQVNRITNTSLKEIPEVVVPNVSKPGDTETMWAFPSDEPVEKNDEGVDVILRAKLEYQLRKNEVEKTL